MTVAVKPKTKDCLPFWLWYAFKVAGWINPDFWTRYATTVGKTVYVPSDEWWEGIDGVSKQSLLRHEQVHIKDSEKWGLLYYISYLFPPAFLTFRWVWELRAYTQTLICWHEGDRGIRDEDIDWLVGIFTGRGYAWMMPFKGFIRRKLESIRARIIAGEISGSDWPHS